MNSLGQGLNFESGEDKGSRVVTYTLPLENYSTSVIYIRHVGASMLGLTLVKTVEWSTQRPDFAGSNLSETITYRVGPCSLVYRHDIDTTLRARTYNGTWRTIKLSLVSSGNTPWQLGILQLLCPALSR